ncbi:hypothetical protein ANCDUO_24594 [Ancylostoma duodenale]|uniref:CAAX prenyl protease 1 N-terminal domain-containing protein n=1 Tax=Ancylostoma duodenale TaxID=51022 RepID=A0A0C2FKK8_9BILA|nr:hypothetical protein ANCDUO_24594 [Ancylostoma duodenale]
MICLIVLFAFTEWITINGGSKFFIYIWLVISALAFVFIHIFPEYIAPWFDKFVPLPDGDLKVIRSCNDEVVLLLRLRWRNKQHL